VSTFCPIAITAVNCSQPASGRQPPAFPDPSNSQRLHRPARLRISPNCRRCGLRQKTSEDTQARKLARGCPTSCSWLLSLIFKNLKTSMTTRRNIITAIIPLVPIRNPSMMVSFELTFAAHCNLWVVTKKYSDPENPPRTQFICCPNGYVYVFRVGELQSEIIGNPSKDDAEFTAEVFRRWAAAYSYRNIFGI